MVIQNSIQQLAQWLSESRHVVAFTGAGISTPSGIPDFRSDQSGLWENVNPMEVASIHGFRRNPNAFFKWVHPLAQTTFGAKPNQAHCALVTLEQHGILHSVITQNIDMLHTRAGNKTVYELHGHMREATCINCFTVYDGVPIMRKFIDDGLVPHCPDCAGVLKPNVILFGEQLPIQVLQSAQKAARDCDLMLVVGSSLEVAPASEIPIIAKRHGAKLVIVNLSTTDTDGYADLVIRGDAAEILPSVVQYTQTLLQNTIDQSLSG